MKLQQARIASPTLRVMRTIFSAVAAPDKIIWIQLDDLDCKALYDLTLYSNDILPGDWDQRVKALDLQIKNRSIVQRFRDGVAWRDTDLFKQEYSQRLDAGGTVKGFQDIALLERYYEMRIDAVYADMKKHGFRVAFNGHGMLDIPHVHVGRAGRFLFGNNGNHRVAMAKLLGVKRIPCHVRARHLAWQQLRDRVAAYGHERCWDVIDPKFTSHSDLQDLLGVTTESTAQIDLVSVAERIPFMQEMETKRRLQALAHDVLPDTAVVEIGSWLGAGTAQLALGLRDRVGDDCVQIHCYDHWRATLRDVTRAARRGMQLRVGEDLLPRVERTLAPFGVPVTFHQGALEDAKWHGEPISLYIDDTATTPGLFYRTLCTFGPSWVPGKTVIMLMDSKFWKRTERENTFQKQVIETYSHCFEPIARNGSALFRYTAPLDFDALAIDEEIWALSERVAACNATIRGLEQSTSWRITAPLRRCGETLRWSLRIFRARL